MQRLLATAFVLALSTACSGRPYAPELEPLASATLEPGRGLGPLRLGETTLGSFVDTYGVGGVAILAGDEVAIELIHARGQLAVLFPLVTGEGVDPFEFDFKHAGRDLQGFLLANSAYRELSLSSLSVAGGGSYERSFFQGALPSGVKLYDLPAKLGAGPDEVDASLGSFVAGMSEHTPEERYVFGEGLVAYAEPPKEGEPSVLKRLTVFAPQMP